MTKGYKVLQKKLKELESDLSRAIFSPPLSDDDHQLLAADLEQRFLFVKNLLTAEVASSSSTRHRHLRHIARTVEALEFDFNEWKDHREITHGGGDAPNSVCSCDGGSGSEDDASNVRTGDQDGLYFTEDVKLEMEKAADRGGGDGDECGGGTVAVGKDKGGGKIGSYFGGLMTGMIFGMFLMGWIMGLDPVRGPRNYPTVHRVYFFPT